MRNRMLNPDFWIDEEVAKVSPHARLLYMGLWGLCDDNYATFPDRPDWIKLQVLPYDSVSTHELLTELETIGKIIRFSHAGKNYWYLKNFLKHQIINRPSRPKYPPFKQALTEYSRSTHSELKKEIKKEGLINIKKFKPESLK